MNVYRTLQRALERFLEDPASTRIAALLIGAATITAVVVGGVAMRLLDHREYPTLGRAFWFTLQTVTTVGYGDVTPTTVIGRVVATAVMLAGIGFLTITTAAITSMFVEASRRRLAVPADATGAMAEGRARDLQSLTARLDQIDEKLAALVEQTRP
jgi:voltage-gated potassium channel